MLEAPDGAGPQNISLKLISRHHALAAGAIPIVVMAKRVAHVVAITGMSPGYFQR